MPNCGQPSSSKHVTGGATVAERAERLARSPPTKGIRVHHSPPPRLDHSGFSRVRIVQDDAVGRQVFSGISRFPRLFIPALLHNPLQSPSSALKTSMLIACGLRLILPIDWLRCRPASGLPGAYWRTESQHATDPGAILLARAAAVRSSSRFPFLEDRELSGERNVILEKRKYLEETRETVATSATNEAAIAPWTLKMLLLVPECKAATEGDKAGLTTICRFLQSPVQRGYYAPPLQSHTKLVNVSGRIRLQRLRSPVLFPVRHRHRTKLAVFKQGSYTGRRGHLSFQGRTDKAHRLSWGCCPKGGMRSNFYLKGEGWRKDISLNRITKSVWMSAVGESEEEGEEK
ncbi:hypothetical protein PR048_032826 [Dryococelus australis]|uniref:Ribosomal protein L2 n=1 Tax=Dryococelus australis TaxID=614101 RepID=A0ABQ9G3B7_9NEOP|nr:hypothetical protein PR048_032826 [Dryococelus australis]